MDYEAFYKVTYGLYVVCAGQKNDINGYIANTVFQVTAEPPTFAISCNIKNMTASLIDRYNTFSFSIISKGTDRSIITDFGFTSGRDIKKFDDKQFKYGVSGTPILLSDCIAAFECRLIKRIELGTHVLFIGEVTDSELLIKNGNPLTYSYYRDFFRASSPVNAPTYMAHQKKIMFEVPEEQQKYLCPICGYIYEPENGDLATGIRPGTPFNELPADWECPICSANKSVFIPE